MLGYAGVPCRIAFMELPILAAGQLVVAGGPSVGVIFISHSGKDNAEAILLRDWLVDQGWGKSQIFIDLENLYAGDRWRQQLNVSGSSCEAVILCLSDNWLRSPECLREHNFAESAGKTIIPIIVREPISERIPSFIADLQFANIASDDLRNEGFHKLRTALLNARISPTMFPWPPPEEPDRAPYRGLRTLEEADAAVFFGRDADITKGLDALRRMRDGSPERILTILGASGAGKSSFLRAGLLARLRRDTEQFYLLPLVRPQRAALTGVTGLHHAFGLTQDASLEALRSRLDTLRTLIGERFQRSAAGSDETLPGRLPTLVLAIDQAEELFAVENTEAAAAMDLLHGALQLDSNLLVALTIRSDSFERLQNEPRLASVPLLPFNLPRLSPGSFKEVIEGPGQLAKPPLKIEPELTSRLLDDLNQADALPLLAFTMERLASDYGGDGRLQLAEYTDGLKGLDGAIACAVEAAFDCARLDTSLPSTRPELELFARRAFIPWLVRIDDADAPPKRRIASLSELPEETRKLVGHFVNQRLLVSDQGSDGALTIEVCHEAVLRNWSNLAIWLGQERRSLRVLDEIQTAAARYFEIVDHDMLEMVSVAAPGLAPNGIVAPHGTSVGAEEQEAAVEPTEIADDHHKSSWLVHRGQRLEEIQLAHRTVDWFWEALGESGRKYVAACEELEARERQDQERRVARELELVEAREREVANSVAANARARRNTLIGAGAAVALSIAALIAGWRALEGFDHAKLQEAAAARKSSSVIAEQARAMFADGSGDATESILMALQADPLAQRSEASRKFDGSDGYPLALARLEAIHAAYRPTLMFTDGTQPGRFLAYLPNGKQFATASSDGAVWIRDSKSGELVTTLIGHTDLVTSVAFSSDGTQAATGSRDKSTRVWKLETGKLVAIITGRDANISSVTFSVDGTRVATAWVDGLAHIWESSSGKLLATLDGIANGTHVVPDDSPGYEKQERELTFIAFTADGRRVVTLARNGTAVFWNAVTGEPLTSFSGVVPGDHARLARDTTRIATASGDGTVEVWDTMTGSRIAKLSGHRSRVRALAFSDDDSLVATASEDGTARVWNAGTGASVSIMRGDAAGIYSMMISSDNTKVTTIGFGPTQIWDLGTGTIVASLDSRAAMVPDVAYSPDGKQLAISTGRTIFVRNSHTGELIRSLEYPQNEVYSLTYSPDSSQLAVHSGDQVVRVWNLSDRNPSTVLSEHRSDVTSVAFSSDGLRVASASSDGFVRLWDTASGEYLGLLGGHTDQPSSVAFSSDGARVAVGSYTRETVLWDARTSERLISLAPSGTTFVAFSPDGRLLATAIGSRATIWEIASGEETQTSDFETYAGHGMASVDFSHDGTRILTAANLGFQVWTAATGEHQISGKGHRDTVQTAVFSPDGTRVVTVSNDQTARIWDSTTGSPLVTLRGHKGAVFSASYSGDGRLIVTASRDGSARIWDAASGETVAVFDGHDGEVQSVAWSPDGRRIATGSTDRTVRIWEVPDILLASPIEKVRMACDALARAGAKLAFNKTDAQRWPILKDEPVDSQTGDFASPCRGILPDETLAAHHVIWGTKPQAE